MGAEWEGLGGRKDPGGPGGARRDQREPEGSGGPGRAEGTGGAGQDLGEGCGSAKWGLVGSLGAVGLVRRCQEGAKSDPQSPGRRQPQAGPVLVLSFTFW